MAGSSDRRILNLPLISSGNVTNSIVLPLDDPSDNITKKINLNQIKDFVLSGFTGTTINNNFLPLSGGTVNGNTIFNSGLTASTLTVNGVNITGDTFVTGGTYISGGTIILKYNTGGDSQPITGLTEDLNSQIDGLAEADEQTIELDTINNVIRLKETIAASTSGTRIFEGNINVNGVLSATTLYVDNQFIINNTFTPSSSGDTSGIIGQITYDTDFLYVKTSLGWGRLGLDYGF
jgi:hypothetical protein